MLHDHIHEYSEIGQLLGVSYAKRETIRKDYTIPDPKEKMNSIVAVWIEKETSNVTWEHFIEAMKDGELRKLVGEITKYTETDEVKESYADIEEWVSSRK